MIKRDISQLATYSIEEMWPNVSEKEAFYDKLWKRTHRCFLLRNALKWLRMA